MRNAFADTMQTQGLSAICGIGLGADSEEKHEPASDIDTVVVDSLKALDPKRPIREADIDRVSPATAATAKLNWRLSARIPLL